MRRRQAGRLLLVATLLLLGGSVLTGSVAAQTATAPDCSTVEYSQDTDGNYEIESASELQCIGEGSTDTTLSDDFVQIADIDASETAEWNDGAGFIPIGAGTPFTGTFDGNGNDITGLTISRDTSSVGLFGVLGTRGGVTDISLVDVSISGTDEVGAVAGRTDGTILRTSVSGAVVGRERVGGITGDNVGTIELSHATSEIGGQSRVGGLVGENDGTVRTTYTAGPVSGLEETGGLVGTNTGVVEESYWDTEATGQEASAGGTRLTTTAMTGPAARSGMEAFDFQATWEVGGSESYPQLRPSTSSGVELSDYRSVGDRSTLETLTMVDFAIGGGSGVVMTIALYLLASRSRRGRAPVEPGQTDGSAEDTDDTPERTGAVASGQTTSTGSGLDDRLDKLKRKIQAARVPYEKEKYERALDLCDEALFIAEDALDTAHAEAPNRVDDVEALHDKATRLRQNIWEEWREEQQTTGDGAQILEGDRQTDREIGDQGTERQPQRGEDEPASQPGDSGEPPVEEDLIDDPEESDDIEWRKPDEGSDDQ